MKISTKGRYALKIGLELARQYAQNPEGLLDLKTIAKNQRLSLKYLEHIMTLLRRKGLVKSVRGLHGGYRLARPPEQLSLLDILEASENISAICPCLCRTKPCPFFKSCGLCDIWEGLRNSIKSYLSSQTLRDAYQSHLRKTSPGNRP